MNEHYYVGMALQGLLAHPHRGQATASELIEDAVNIGLEAYKRTDERLRSVSKSPLEKAAAAAQVSDAASDDNAPTGENGGPLEVGDSGE